MPAFPFPHWCSLDGRPSKGCPHPRLHLSVSSWRETVEEFGRGGVPYVLLCYGYFSQMISSGVSNNSCRFYKKVMDLGLTPSGQNLGTWLRVQCECNFVHTSRSVPVFSAVALSGLIQISKCPVSNSHGFMYLVITTCNKRYLADGLI